MHGAPSGRSGTLILQILPDSHQFLLIVSVSAQLPSAVGLLGVLGRLLIGLLGGLGGDDERVGSDAQRVHKLKTIFIIFGKKISENI